MSKNTPVLCGGTFFALISEAKKERLRVRSRNGTLADELSDRHLILGLLRIFNDSGYYDIEDEAFMSSLRTSVNNYKVCSDKSYGIIDFNNQDKIDEFNGIVTKNYNVAVSRFSEFIDTYLEVKDKSNKITKKADRLVRSLIQLVIEAKNVNDDDIFYIEETPIKKTAFTKLKKVKLDSFLLGIFHYIIVKCKDNKIGSDTFLEWHEKDKNYNSPTRAPWIFKSNIGNKITTKITIAYESKNKIEHIAPEALEPDEVIENTNVIDKENIKIEQHADKILNFNERINNLNIY